MSYSSFGGTLPAMDLDSATATSHETAVFGQVNKNEEKANAVQK